MPWKGRLFSEFNVAFYALPRGNHYYALIFWRQNGQVLCKAPDTRVISVQWRNYLHIIIVKNYFPLVKFLFLQFTDLNDRGLRFSLIKFSEIAICVRREQIAALLPIICFRATIDNSAAREDRYNKFPARYSHPKDITRVVQFQQSCPPF